MAFLKDLGKVIGDAASDAQKKTSLMLEVSKLNSAIKTEKEAIEKTQEKIGATMYSMFTAGETIPDAIIADCQAITSKLEAISGLEVKIADLKREDQKAAGGQPEAGSSASAGGSKFCSGCGAVLTPGAVFCNQCGHKNG